MSIAVTGAAGAIGSLVVRGLAAGGHHVTAVVRRPGSAPLIDGVRECVASYDDTAALVEALSGAQQLVLIGSDGEADRMVIHHYNILAAAAADNVRKIIFLSSQDADLASPFCYARTYAHTESWIRAASPTACIVRANIYSEFFRRWVLAGGEQGVLELPLGSFGIAPIARSDVAAALLACADGDFSAQTLVITGPRCLDMNALAVEASFVVGRDVRSADCTADKFAHDLVDTEPNPWWRYAYSTMFAAIAQGRFSETTSDLTSLTGSVGVDFRSVLAGEVTS